MEDSHIITFDNHYASLIFIKMNCNKRIMCLPLLAFLSHHSALLLPNSVDASWLCKSLSSNWVVNEETNWSER